MGDDGDDDKLWTGEYNFIGEEKDRMNESKDIDESKFLGFQSVSLVTDRIVQVCATRCSTIVIIKSNSSNNYVSEVYQWGCGTHTPIQQKFMKPSISNYFTQRTNNKWSEVAEYANIDHISAGLNHFIGIDSFSGYVYAWYQQSQDATNTYLKLSTPEIIENLFPEKLGII